MLDALEKKLSYDDLRFYRSIARSQLKKDLAARKKLDEEKKKQQPAQSRGSWTGWLWGSSSTSTTQTAIEETPFSGEMTDEQRKQLYEALDYDEKTALASSFETPRDALNLRVAASLQRGSFALKTDPHGRDMEIISIQFDRFQADFLQRPDNFETSLSLTSFAVYDGTTKNTVYPFIVQVQDKNGSAVSGASIDATDPFFYLKFESNPLDERANSALTMRMRNMEVVYHKGYIEAIYKFFKPPSSQMESVEALLVRIFVSLGHNLLDISPK
jgi:vacuolar protein sorting-associated protein 13A/C